MTRMVLSVGIGLLLTVGTVWAGPLEDGTAANKRGDYATALKTFQSLAAQGNAEAQNNLAELYYAGLGVPQDYVRAYMWVNLAAVHMKGDEQKEAAENRDDVARHMTPEQIAEAKRLTQQCLAQKFKGC